MQNRGLVRSEGGLVRVALCGIAVLGLMASGCSTTNAGDGGGGVLTGDTLGGDGSLTGDTGAGGDAGKQGDAAGGTDIPADAIADSSTDVAKPDVGQTDTGPDDTGPNDTGPSDTGPSDTGPADTGPWSGPVFGTDGKSGSVQKVVTIAFGAKTEGCDLNGDGKVDNTMSGLSGIAGKPLQDALDKDSLDMLFEPKSYNTTGTPFPFNVLLGDPETGSTCKNPSAGCNYTVKASSYVNKTCDASSCTSMVSFPSATINGSALKATADKFIITLTLSGAPLDLTISKVQLSGTVADSTSWKTTSSGMLCGYVTDKDLNAAIDALPASALASYGGASAVKGLLPILVPSDISSTQGGPKDAKSLGLKLTTVSATITGLSP